jgi:ketopantoate reductase
VNVASVRVCQTAKELGDGDGIDLVLITTKCNDTEDALRGLALPYAFYFMLFQRDQHRDKKKLIPYASEILCDGGAVLIIQNGMAESKALVQANIRTYYNNDTNHHRPLPHADSVLGKKRFEISVLEGVTDMGALLVEPGTVQHTGRGLTIIENVGKVSDRIRDAFVMVCYYFIAYMS